MEQNNKKQNYEPKTDIQYPDDPFSFIIVPEIIDFKTKIDCTYPYYDTSFKAKFKRTIFYIIGNTVGYFLNKKRYGAKIIGKKNLRKYKKQLKNGAITISNHVYRWDFLTIMNAFNPHHIFFPVRKDQVLTKDKVFIRNVGGIPIPEDLGGSIEFYKAFDRIHKKKYLIHFFPEASRWDFYTPIRPFKAGAFKLAYKYDVPIIPMAFSYRENKKKNAKNPLITLNIGEPIFIDKTLPKKEAIDKLHRESHEAVVKLANIENNKRNYK